MTLPQLHQQIKNNIQTAVVYLNFYKNISDSQAYELKLTPEDIDEEIQKWEVRYETLDDIRLMIEE